MTAVVEVLHRHGFELDDKDFAADLDRALTGIGAATSPTSTDKAYLVQHGGGDTAAIVATFDPAVARRQQAAAAVQTVKEIYDSSVTIAAAAKLLRIDRTRVSHRLRNGELWSIGAAANRRIPIWQVTVDGHTLPHLADIIAAIPTGTHPLAVQDVMTTPQDITAGRTPAVYLAAGGDPGPVVHLVGQLDRW